MASGDSIASSHHHSIPHSEWRGGGGGRERERERERERF